MTRRPAFERLLVRGRSLGVVATLVAGLGVNIDAVADIDGRESVAENESPFNFLARFGLEAERTALESGGEPRRRALRRLFTLGHRAPRQSANLLDEWLAESPKLSDLEMWLLVRTLTNLHAEPTARRHLANILAGEGLEIDPKSPYASTIPKTAALGLAKSGDTETSGLLGEWLRRPTERANWVREALLTHRPRQIAPLLEANGPATALLMETLGDLGDPRAIPYLRSVVKRSTADVQAAAAVALAKLNVRETQDLATLWLRRTDTRAELIRASTWILFHFKHPRRGAAFEELLRRQPASGLEFAERAVPDVYLTSLGQYLDRLPDRDHKRRALSVLSRVGAEAVAPLIEVMRGDADLRWDAAAALGDLDSGKASLALWGSLDAPHLAAPSLAALVVHAVFRGDVDQRRELVRELRRRTKSEDGETRTIALAGLAVLDETQARAFLASEDQAQRLAAILASGVWGDDYRRACLDRFHELARSESSETSRLTPKTLESSAALSFASSNDSLSPRLLRALTNSDDPIADVARWHGWLRGGASLGFAPPPTDAFVARRAAHALSLGATEVGAAQVSKAILDLQTESHPEVRAALVSALQRHPELSTVAEALHWHAHYDPDPWVRTLAAIGNWPVGLRAVWVSPPATERPSTHQYWVRITHPNHPPIGVLLNHRHPTLLFVQHLRQVTVSEIPYPSAATATPNTSVLDVPYLRVETLDPLSRLPAP